MLQTIEVVFDGQLLSPCEPVNLSLTTRVRIKIEVLA